ncbi:MAG: hypothetical protein M1838_005190 [Thelocarpon superellum]|nr:MAG: hypothetical protein M1838_005190 [Thelocarpon superellum]
MSTVSSWLRGQRKTELVELANDAGLKDFDSLKKSELEAKLDEYLRAHESTLSKQTRFTPFYSRVGSSGSPVKRESAGPTTSGPTSDGESKPVKAVRRRVTKVADEISNTTPRSSLSVARSVPLPPSPAVVADAIDRRTAVLRNKVGNAWDQSGVTEQAEWLRSTLSSVASIENLVLAVEAYGLREEVLPSRYAFTIPAIALLRTPAWPVFLPDLFLLLTSSLWSPVTLWLATSLTLPLAAAFFINLTLKHKPSGLSTRAHAKTAQTFDPLTFNVVKALVAFVVYSQDVKFGGWLSDDSVDRVRGAVPGGAEGIIIGAAIGVLTSLYDAVLKK